MEENLNNQINENKIKDDITQLVNKYINEYKEDINVLMLITVKKEKPEKVAKPRKKYISKKGMTEEEKLQYRRNYQKEWINKQIEKNPESILAKRKGPKYEITYNDQTYTVKTLREASKLIGLSEDQLGRVLRGESKGKRYNGIVLTDVKISRLY